MKIKKVLSIFFGLIFLGSVSCAPVFMVRFVKKLDNGTVKEVLMISCSFDGDKRKDADDDRYLSFFKRMTDDLSKKHQNLDSFDEIGLIIYVNTPAFNRRKGLFNHKSEHATRYHEKESCVHTYVCVEELALTILSSSRILF